MKINITLEGGFRYVNGCVYFENLPVLRADGFPSPGAHPKVSALAEQQRNDHPEIRQYKKNWEVWSLK